MSELAKTLLHPQVAVAALGLVGVLAGVFFGVRQANRGEPASENAVPGQMRSVHIVSQISVIISQLDHMIDHTEKVALVVSLLNQLHDMIVRHNERSSQTLYQMEERIKRIEQEMKRE